MTSDPRPAAPGHVDLVDGARRLGHLVWFERRMFEVLGGWVPSTAEPEAKLALGAHRRHAGWRAGQLFDRLPEQRELPAEELVAPAGPQVVAALDRAADLTGTAERLGAVYRALAPRQLSALRAELARVPEVSAPTTARSLAMVLDDLGRDVAAGEAALEAVVVDGPALDRATGAAAAVEAELLAGGGGRLA